MVHYDGQIYFRKMDFLLAVYNWFLWHYISPFLYNYNNAAIREAHQCCSLLWYFFNLDTTLRQIFRKTRQIWNQEFFWLCSQSRMVKVQQDFKQNWIWHFQRGDRLAKIVSGNRYIACSQENLHQQHIYQLDFEKQWNNPPWLW